MITFKYIEQTCNNTDITVEAGTYAEHIGAVVQAFKDFLIHVGYDHGNVERVVFFEKEDRQALPQQLDLFKDGE